MEVKLGQQKNRTSKCSVTYEFVEDLLSDSIEIAEYKKNAFANYFFSITEKKVYFFNGLQYKILHSRRSDQVNMSDINRKFMVFKSIC